MSIKTCVMCKGYKTIVGLGMLVHDCPNCEGVGHVKESRKYKDEDEEDEEKLQPRITYKRRGRPKREVLPTNPN